MPSLQSAISDKEARVTSDPNHCRVKLPEEIALLKKQIERLSKQVDLFQRHIEIDGPSKSITIKARGFKVLVDNQLVLKAEKIHLN